MGTIFTVVGMTQLGIKLTTYQSQIGDSITQPLGCYLNVILLQLGLILGSDVMCVLLRQTDNSLNLLE